MYKLPQRKLRKDLGIAALANYKEQLPRTYVGWLSANFFQQLTNWSLTSHHQKWNVKIMMMNCHSRVLWFWPREFWELFFTVHCPYGSCLGHLHGKNKASPYKCTPRLEGWGVLQISSGGDDQRIFLGLKFLIPGFFWVGLGRSFSSGLTLLRIFLGINSNSLNICGSGNVSWKLRLRNLAWVFLRVNVWSRDFFGF